MIDPLPHAVWPALDSLQLVFCAAGVVGQSDPGCCQYLLGGQLLLCHHAAGLAVDMDCDVGVACPSVVLWPLFLGHARRGKRNIY